METKDLQLLKKTLKLEIATDEIILAALDEQIIAKQTLLKGLSPNAETNPNNGTR